MWVTNDTKNVITETGQTIIYDSGAVNSVLEEVDNRIVCHISDIISKGYWKIIVHTVDSDVVLIFLGFMSEFTAANPSVEITVDFKTSSERKYISINSICSNLGSEYLFWFSILLLLTRADSTCSSFNRSKMIGLRNGQIFQWKKSWMNCFAFYQNSQRKASFDTTIFCLCLSKKIWFHWLRWIVRSNVCEFELKWFQGITTIQICPILTFTAGIL